MKKLLALVILAAMPAMANEATPSALLKNGHYKRAKVLAEQRLRSNPNDAEANYALARFREAQGDLDAAEPLAEKACQLDPKNAEYRYLLAGIYGQKADKANIFKAPGLAKKFKAGAEQAIQLDPKYIEPRMGLIQFHMQAPGIVGGDKSKAPVLADEIAKIDPARGYLARAAIAIREKQTAGLGDLYRKAVEANPKNYQALMTLSSFYGSDQQKNYGEAERLAREALRLEPDRIGAYNQLAALCALQKRWKELDEVLVLAEKNISDNLTPLYQAGRVLMQSNLELQRAEGYFRKYLTQEPEPGAPTHAHAWWRLGNTLEKQGRKAEAIQALETAVRLKPDLDDAKKDLKRLK